MTQATLILLIQLFFWGLAVFALVSLVRFRDRSRVDILLVMFSVALAPHATKLVQQRIITGTNPFNLGTCRPPLPVASASPAFSYSTAVYPAFCFSRHGVLNHCVYIFQRQQQSITAGVTLLCSS